MTATIISASDASDFHLLKGLILSTRDKPEGEEIALSTLDVGLENNQRCWLKARGAIIAEPERDFDILSSFEAPSHFRALLARPFLPRYFPGHNVYLHIDSDAWVKNWEAVEICITAAKRGSLAVTPQIDRSYNTIYELPRPYRRTQN